MAENLIVKDIQKLDPGSALVDLYELEVASGSFAYFTPFADDDASYSALQFRDYDTPATVRSYTRIPMKAEGFEIKASGAIARPKVSIANVSNTLSNAVGGFDYHVLVGLRIIRRLTLKKYLDDGSGNSSNPPVELARQVWIIDRITSRDKMQVTFQCVAPYDISETKVPQRTILPERCPFLYAGASPDLPEWKRDRSGCTWHQEGKYRRLVGGDATGTQFTVYVNPDDEYIIPSTTSFTTWPGSGNATLDGYYKTADTKTRFEANGETSSVSSFNYWQAAKATAPGNPADDNANWNRVRLYSAYSHGTEYFTYLDDRDNDYVTFTDNVATSHTNGKALCWKARSPSKSQPPASGTYWERGDNCSKRTQGCKMRFGFKPGGGGSSGTSATGKTTTNTAENLPFGGFPASKTFS